MPQRERGQAWDRMIAELKLWCLRSTVGQKTGRGFFTSLEVKSKWFTLHDEIQIDTHS